MSRVHDALRKAETAVFAPQAPSAAPVQETPERLNPAPAGPAAREVPELHLDDFLARIKSIPFTPSPDASLLDVNRPNEAQPRSFAASGRGSTTCRIFSRSTPS